VGFSRPFSFPLDHRHLLKISRGILDKDLTWESWRLADIPVFFEKVLDWLLHSGERYNLSLPGVDWEILYGRIAC
jgi:hypothetical protein